MSNPWRARWKHEYEPAVKRNSRGQTVVLAKEGNYSTWRVHLKDRDGQMHLVEVRLEYHTKDGRRSLPFPLYPPEVEWLTPISHPNIQPPSPEGNGIVDLAPLPEKVHSWSPKTHLVDILDLLELLLHNPNPADPINHPTCLRAAIDLIREKLSPSSSSSAAERVKRMVTEAEGIVRRYSSRWNSVTQVERDRAWYLVVEAEKALSFVK